MERIFKEIEEHLEKTSNNPDDFLWLNAFKKREEKVENNNNNDQADIRAAQIVEDHYENNPEDFITYEQYREKKDA